MIICSLMPNLAGAFGLRFVPTDQHVARLICYYLTGPYNAGPKDLRFSEMLDMLMF